MAQSPSHRFGQIIGETLRYSNGDEIRGQFKDKSAAISFLRNAN